MLTNYLWNVELSQALYPILQAVEVSLRNSIHAAATARYNSEFWFDLPHVLLSAQRRRIEEARVDLRKMGKPLTPGRMIAGLTLGFWVHLFDRPYERAPATARDRLSWHDTNLAMLHAVFPNAPRRARNRAAIRRQCDAIRDLRNRVFHYEAIWQRPTLDREHAAILALIAWISPEMRDAIALCDRFTLAYHEGKQNVAEHLNLLLATE